MEKKSNQKEKRKRRFLILYIIIEKDRERCARAPIRMRRCKRKVAKKDLLAFSESHANKVS